MIDIIIADDHELFAEGLETLLASTGEYNVVEKVTDGKKLIQALNKFTPQLILLDINMPYLSGTDAAVMIRKRHADMKIAFITMYDDHKILSFCKANGINGYLLKHTKASELKIALQQIIRGEYVYTTHTPTEPADIHENVFEESFARKLKLSKREIEIISLIKKGYSSKEIAGKLFLSGFTVETHRKNIFRKLQVSSVGALIQFANQYQL
ncbi:MAG: response regulator transcription factor [Mucilaginibacter sp.]|jgi:DNA-binding NarL/FixJ family response regulator|uniref:response regulator n=1 Tax=Mucilaginibacter sp. TaxID=1882438 RepID=UPI003563B571